MERAQDELREEVIKIYVCQQFLEIQSAERGNPLTRWTRVLVVAERIRAVHSPRGDSGKMDLLDSE